MTLWKGKSIHLLMMTHPTSTAALEVAEELQESRQPMETGLRKLVRPRLPERIGGVRAQPRQASAQLLTHQDSGNGRPAQHDRHAEFFYFQKQIQAQTPMIFVLDDGEQIEGIIEWCDLHVIKVRHTTRTMIYKSSIKYLYKASDLSNSGPARLRT